MKQCDPCCQLHLVQHLHLAVNVAALAAATTVLAVQNANVLGGKSLKTKLNATNATMRAQHA